MARKFWKGYKVPYTCEKCVGLVEPMSTECKFVVDFFNRYARAIIHVDGFGGWSLKPDAVKMLSDGVVDDYYWLLELLQIYIEEVMMPEKQNNA